VPGTRTCNFFISFRKFAAAACYARFLISNFFTRIPQVLDWQVICHDLNSEAGCAPRGDSWKKILSPDAICVSIPRFRL